MRRTSRALVLTIVATAPALAAAQVPADPQPPPRPVGSPDPAAAPVAADGSATRPSLAPPPATYVFTDATPVADPGAGLAKASSSRPGEPWSMRFGGYVQPQFRLREDSPAQFDEDGFRLARTRFTATAEGSTGSLDLTAYMEAELQPTFSLLDAFATVSRKLPAGGLVTLDFGQTRVPISRQQLLSDSRLAFVDKAQLATIAPDRDLGARLAFVAPHVPWIRVVGGVFNGEGRNQVENINQKYLYAGRLEVSPFGTAMPLAESSFGGDLLTAAVSVGHNSLTPGQFKEDLLYLGADLSAAWHGISGSVEYLEVRHTFSGNRPGPDYKANGWTAQLNYMLPMELPSGQGRFEVGARVEEIDRNDAVPIAQLGDPNQSVREYTAVASYYLRKHDAKIQLAASHFTEIEDRTVTSDNASYPNDQLLLQVTYRVE